MQYYKCAKLDGWDFYTGNTINYRVNIGKTVTVPTFQVKNRERKYSPRKTRLDSCVQRDGVEKQ